METRERFPRTLFVLDNLYISGAEKVAVNLLRHAQARGLPAEGVVYMDDHLGADACGARLQVLGGMTGDAFLGRVVKGVCRLPALARMAEGFDLLVPVTPPAIPWAVAAGAASDARVVPSISYDLEGFALDRFNTSRILRDSLMNGLYTRVAPAFDRLLFASHAALESFARTSGGAKRGWVVVPNMYDRQTLSDAPSACAAALDRCRASGKAALLFAARISRVKRWQEAIKVAGILRAKGFAFELHFAGDGPEMDQLRDAVSASPARENLFLHGFDMNVPVALGSADALLMTSLTEVWPTVILEAFDAGIPVLSYDCPSGPREMLGWNLDRGVLCDDAEEMAERIMWLLDSRQGALRQQMAAGGREFLEDHLPDRGLARWGEALRGMMSS